MLDLGRSMVPIYVQLVTIFRRLIATGQWALNAQIPTLDMLSEEFGVARATIRQAIGLLENEGLLRRFRRRGTFVKAKPHRKVRCRIPTDWPGMVAAYDELDCTWLESQPAAVAPIAHHTAKKMAKRYQRIHAFYQRDGMPRQLETINIDRSLFHTTGINHFANWSIVKWLHEFHDKDISRIDQTILAGMSDTETSPLLEISINSPLTIVYHSFLGRGGVHICEIEGLYPADLVYVEEDIIP